MTAVLTPGQLRRIDLPSPAAAPGGSDLTIRTLKQGDGEQPPHYWDSAQGADLAAEAPLPDWEIPPSTSAMPAGGSPEKGSHYWDESEDVSRGASSSSEEVVAQGRDPYIYEHRWSMPRQDASTLQTQVRQPSVEGTAMCHAASEAGNVCGVRDGTVHGVPADACSTCIYKALHRPWQVLNVSASDTCASRCLRLRFRPWRWSTQTSATPAACPCASTQGAGWRTQPRCEMRSPLRLQAAPATA